jgi:hypothetical protein
MKFKIYVGCNYNGGSFTRPEAKNIINDCMEFNGINAYTVYDVNGVWNGETEETELIEIYGGLKNFKQVINVCKDIKNNLYQNCVGLSFSFIPFITI